MVERQISVVEKLVTKNCVELSQCGSVEGVQNIGGGWVVACQDSAESHEGSGDGGWCWDDGESLGGSEEGDGGPGLG